MGFKKGQVALEFMMTYGWAILVVLAAIGTLSYFGIMNPSKFASETCLTTSGFACLGKPIISAMDGDTGEVMFSIANGMGRSILLNKSKVSLRSFDCSTISICGLGKGSGPTCTSLDNSVTAKTFTDSSGVTVNMSNCYLGDIQVLKGEVLFNYTNPQSGLTDVLIVTLAGKPRR